jgi:hypothetical protein
MQISVGIDIAKELHWVAAIDADGIVRLGSTASRLRPAVSRSGGAEPRSLRYSRSPRPRLLRA